MGYKKNNHPQLGNYKYNFGKKNIKSLALLGIIQSSADGSLFLPLVNFSREGLQHCFARMIFNRSYQLLIGFALVVGKHTLYSQNMRLLSIRERKTQGQNTTMSVYPNKFAEQLIKGKLHLYTSMQSKTLVQ